ncbi:MAG: hypothetical protein J3K34DRAFT_413424 [Monoraphidium minutum]|nr:MAG: hypothetical protein J3K34DRAFT_432852 [Monoraphidium minutum]KAI8472722.1 MAG: hypothetical protein J3K34DRAFT_413424 [Monoraphidium minutum]
MVRVRWGACGAAGAAARTRRARVGGCRGGGLLGRHRAVQIDRGAGSCRRRRAAACQVGTCRPYGVRHSLHTRARCTPPLACMFARGHCPAARGPPQPRPPRRASVARPPRARQQALSCRGRYLRLCDGAILQQLVRPLRVVPGPGTAFNRFRCTV